MFNRENAVGILLLLVCGGVAVVLLYAIGTGERIRLDLPAWISWPLGITFIGLLLYGMFSNFRSRRSSGGGHAWPDPQSGERSLWDKIRGKNR